MDVLLTHPHFWPHVRRGAEREVHDLGQHLRERGHRVRLLTSQPRGLTSRSTCDGIDVRYVRLPHGTVAARRGVSDIAAFAAVALPGIASMRGDVVAAFHYGDGWAAVQARRVRRRPVVLKLTGTVLEDRIAKVRFDRRLYREAVAGADEVWCNSHYAAEVMADQGRPMAVVPAGVDLGRFRPDDTVARDDPPVVLCTSAPGDPRKRVQDLVDAWPSIIEARPGARLRIAGAIDDAAAARLLDRVREEVRPTVDLTGDLRDDALVDAYRRATVAVSPSVFEALGLSTLEALACGTPVAGARSGATVELVSDGVGCLYEPGDVDACARAVVDTFALAERAETATRCRTAAEPFDWTRITDEVERRFDALVARS
jgi:glycosyltransferase involved in cell wall biosynthesis